MKKTTNILINTIAAITIMVCCLFICSVNSHAAGIGSHDHAMTEWVITREPTCTEYGFEERRCAEGCAYFEARTIAAFGHNNREIGVVEPTCTKAGHTKFVCNTCGKENTDYPKPPQGHKLTEWTITAEATCSENGCEQRHCTECDYTESRIVEATGHEFFAEIQAPTCEEGGYTTYACQHCDVSWIDEAIAPLGHQYELKVVEPTCEQGGYTAYSCTNCDAVSHVQDETAPLGHQLVATVTNPTCEEGGYTTYECQNCDVVYTREETAPLGHELVPSVTKPTCEQDGYTTYSCRNCDTVYVRDKVPAIDHEYGIWQNSKDTYGVATRTCKHCGDVETKTLLPIKKPAIRKDNVFTFAVISRNEHLRISKPSLRPVACHF